MVCAEASCLATVGSDSSQRGSEVSAVCLRDTLQVTSISGCFSGAPGQGPQGTEEPHAMERVRPSSSVSVVSALSLSPQVRVMAEMGIMVA